MAYIWLNKNKYPNNQRCNVSFWDKRLDNAYTRCEINRTYTFQKAIKRVDITFGADTNCYILCNNILIANSNVKTYGDFLYKERSNPEQFFGEKSLIFGKDIYELKFFSIVSMGPVRLSDLSSGFGCFSLEALVTFVDGSTKKIKTDKSWKIKLNSGFKKYNSYNEEDDTEEYLNAEEKDLPIKFLKSKAPIPEDDEVIFDNTFIVKGNKEKEFIRELDRIYSSFIALEVSCESEVDVYVTTYEVDEPVGDVHCHVSSNKYIRYIDLFSIGAIKINIKNHGNSDAKVILHIFHSRLKEETYKGITTDNEKLNDLFQKCYFASVNCSQNYYLDSPKHCEPLASCCGDYAIISKVYGISSGDYSLAKHVLRAYSKSLVRNKGLNANSSYALIFINWLWDIYELTGDSTLLKDCLPGVEAVNEEFVTYVGPSGIIDRPRNYIFMDWLVVDGYSLFAPPSSLGQSVFNMFYYKALDSTSRIYQALNYPRKSGHYRILAKSLKKNINKYLFDANKGLYIEGLNHEIIDKVDPSISSFGIPEGNGKIYYRKHANILAVAFNIANKTNGKKIIHKVFTELKDLEIQPYFHSYTFEAIKNAGLERRYTMKLIKEWISRIKISDKGLPEGFYKPTPDYKFDYSHAWGASPYIGFIKAASGLEIIEPGMKKIKLNLKTLGVKNLSYSIATPFGFIDIKEDKIISMPINIEILK